MGNFLIDVRQWKSVAEFEQHLADYNFKQTAPWAKGITYHHTYRPLPSQWVGRRSMDGLKHHYEIVNGWDRGPHLFIVAGAPNKEHDGIWQLTPLNVTGIHAGACNSTHWGLEIVGDYDKAFWPEPVAQLALGAGAALLRWAGLGVDGLTVRGHRECLPNKTCPGSKIKLPEIRELLKLRMQAATIPAPTTAAITKHSPVLGKPTCTQEQAARWLLKQRHDDYTNGDLSLTIIPAYWELCLSVGINPAVPLAQLVKEGSLYNFWGRRPQRNPAGIGVDGDKSATKPADTTGWAYNTDRRQWEKGISFPSWVGHSIPAHVGRLVAWATKPHERTAAQQQLVEQALAYRNLELRLHGSVSELQHLGRVHNPTGLGWASPGTDYGEKLAEFMTAMQKA
jgi:hypothetical protein